MDISQNNLLPFPPAKEDNIILLPPPKKVILGAEYTNLTPKRKPIKKQKEKIDHTVDRLNELSDSEIKAVYEGMGTSIYLPTFRQYVNTFWDIIKQETKIKADFAVFKNTSIYERFMLNAAQFASSKSVAQNKMLKELLFENGVRKNYSTFKKEAKAVTNVFNDTWLRVEYDGAVRQAVAGEMFRGFKENADIYGWWMYLQTTSSNPRIEHLELVGNVYRIGDPNGDAVFPPGGWNCGCGAEQIDDQYLSENNINPRTSEEAGEDLEKHVDKQFRFDPSVQGILPKESHSYFQALPSANEANGNTFGITNKTSQSTKLKAIGLHEFVKLVHEWRVEYYANGLHAIIFQNKELLTNIVFNNKSFTNIAKHAQGTSKLPETILSPSEVWSRWKDVNTQQDTIRCYIKGNYVVETFNGIITDAYLVDDVNRFRKGVIIY